MPCPQCTAAVQILLKTDFHLHYIQYRDYFISILKSSWEPLMCCYIIEVIRSDSVTMILSFVFSPKWKEKHKLSLALFV